MAPLQPLNYWGNDLSMRSLYDTWNRQREDQFRRDRDLDYYSRYGFFPGQGGMVAGAQDAAEQEWQALVSALEGRMGELRGNETLDRLQSFYQNALSGSDVPYDAGTIASLSSAATDPLARNARGTVDRLREAFAARGMGRGAMLGSLENRVLSDAALASTRAAGDVRNRATEANYGARERAAAGLQSTYENQQASLNALTSELARLRSERAYDPNQFNRGLQRQRTTQTTGGYTTGYSPPPPVDRRRTGRSAPTYRFSATGGRAYGMI